MSPSTWRRALLAAGVAIVLAAGVLAATLPQGSQGPPRLAGLQFAARPRVSPALAPVTVASEPTGPVKPSSGWAVVYADGFAAPLGTGPGEDNTWFPSMGGGAESSCKTPTDDCRGSNADELQVFNSSNQSVTPRGLRLRCDFLAAGTVAVNAKSGEGRKFYRCGAARGPLCCKAHTAEQAGYNAPLVFIEGGATYVFEVTMKLPPNTNEGDPAFWYSGPPYHNCCELDMPEFTSWAEGDGYATQSIRFIWHPATEQILWGIKSFDPAAAFHTYTTQIAPAGTTGKYRVTVWIDGALQTLYDLAEGCGRPPNGCGRTASKEVEAPDPPGGNWNPLILQYAMREGCSSTLGCNSSGGISHGFKTPGEQRSMWIRSVAIYQDSAHENVGIRKPSAGAAAPNTLIGARSGSQAPPAREARYEAGARLYATTGTWTNSPTSFTYRWERCQTHRRTCAPIAGATVALYTVGSADVGHTLRVGVKAANSAGSREASSPQTGEVQPRHST